MSICIMIMHFNFIIGNYSQLNLHIIASWKANLGLLPVTCSCVQSTYLLCLCVAYLKGNIVFHIIYCIIRGKHKNFVNVLFYTVYWCKYYHLIYYLLWELFFGNTDNNVKNILKVVHILFEFWIIYWLTFSLLSI